MTATTEAVLSEPRTTVHAVVERFDFASFTWRREYIRPAVLLSAEPIVNIVERGCLWQDMQRRFRRT
jgi:hypothetical protein